MGDTPSDLQHQAISAALSYNWKEALKINEEIIGTDPKNVEALNRLARAHFELGNLAKSKKYFESSLENDPYNQIALKFIKRIKSFNKKSRFPEINHGSGLAEINSDLFIEEPGKTKLIGLLKVAEPQKLSLLSSGTPINLVIKNHAVAVTDQNNDYLGVLPDDLSHRLIRLIHGGNKYQAFTKTIKTNSLSILIHETYRSPRFRNQPSFLDAQNPISINYSTDNIIITDDMDEESPIEMDADEGIN